MASLPEREPMNYLAFGGRELWRSRCLESLPPGLCGVSAGSQRFARPGTVLHEFVVPVQPPLLRRPRVEVLGEALVSPPPFVPE